MATFEEQIENRASNPSEDSGGIADAVALIQSSAIQNADRSKSVAVIPLKNEPDDSYLVVGADGKHEKHTPEPSGVSGSLVSIDQVARAVVELGGKLVSIDENGVFVHTDKERLAKGVAIELVKDPVWQKLEAIRGGQVFKQEDLIRFLRVDLMGTLDGPGEVLLEWARELNTTERMESQSTRRSEQESLGRSVTTEVTGSGPTMPPAFSVTTRIWTDRAVPVEVTVGVLVDFFPRGETFQLSSHVRQMSELFGDELLKLEERIRKTLQDDKGGVEVIGGDLSGT